MAKRFGFKKPGFYYDETGRYCMFLGMLLISAYQEGGDKPILIFVDTISDKGNFNKPVLWEVIHDEDEASYALSQLCLAYARTMGNGGTIQDFKDYYLNGSMAWKRKFKFKLPGFEYDETGAYVCLFNGTKISVFKDLDDNTLNLVVDLKCLQNEKNILWDSSFKSEDELEVAAIRAVQAFHATIMRGGDVDEFVNYYRTLNNI